MNLRDYQLKMKNDIYSSWKNNKNICGVLPTGAGKTVVFTTILAEHQGYSLAIAHRQELVSQISGALAKIGLRHRLLAPESTRRWIWRLNTANYGEPYYDPQATCVVASVDTLLARMKRPETQEIINQTSLWVIDECHHILRKNKWGKVVTALPHAKGLGVTATPHRADKQGLGSKASGVFDTLVEGPSVQHLIKTGYLSKYRIVWPPSDLNRSVLKVGSTGEYTQKSTIKAIKGSVILGDITQHYLKYASGESGVTFVPSVEMAYQVADQFKAAGVPAAAFYAKTPETERHTLLEKFRQKEILQLVNVDLIGEGLDVPDISVISMARLTRSLGLYLQQVGRALRPGKKQATIIDHVGNIAEHQFPDEEREWTLDSSKKRKAAPLTVRIKVCPNCTSAYKITHSACPFCGHKMKTVKRSNPTEVEGDLVELTPETIQRMRAAIKRKDNSLPFIVNSLKSKGTPPGIINVIKKNFLFRTKAQQELRHTIGVWAAYQRLNNKPDSESYRRFYTTWGIDVLSAQTLNKKKTLKLVEKIKEENLCLQQKRRTS